MVQPYREYISLLLLYRKDYTYLFALATVEPLYPNSPFS